MNTDGKSKTYVIYKAKSKRECMRVLHLLEMVSRKPDIWEIHYGLGRVQSIELTYID